MIHLYLKPLYGMKFTYALVFFIASSWLLFPFVVSWVFPWGTRGLLLISWVSIFLWVVYLKIKVHYNRAFFDKFAKAYLLCMLLYSMALFFASAVNASPDTKGWYYYLSVLSKYVFLFFLIHALTLGSIKRSLALYSNICVILVILSLVNVTGLYFDWWQSLNEYAVLQGVSSPRMMSLSWSGFDGYARIFEDNDYAFRIQSFSMEPGDFSLALLPALYRELFVAQGSKVKFFVLSLGIAATWSLGAVLMLGILSLLYYAFSMNGLKVYRTKAFFLMLSLCIFFLSHFVITDYVRGHMTEQMTGELSNNFDTFVGSNKSGSLSHRIKDIKVALEYLQQHPAGTGAGLGRVTTNSTLSVGYANAGVEAGYVGGLFYIIGFVLLGAGILYALWEARHRNDEQAQLLMVFGSSILTCLFFGLQREQPDSNLWFMWLLACYFYISYRVRKA